MTAWMIALLVALAVAGAVSLCISRIEIKSGWQNGKSPLSKWLDNRRREKFNMQLPEALATMSNALRAGFSISQAFDSVVELGEKPMCEEFRILQQQLRIGMGFDDALESMSTRVGSEDLTLAITAILISRKTGGNITEIFDKISETIRARNRIERKVRSLTAQGRLQGIVASTLPLLLCFVMTAIRPGIMMPFLTSTVGIAAMGIMMALILLGWLMIRKIIRIDV